MSQSPHFECTAHSGLEQRIEASERRLDGHHKEIDKLKGKFTAILTVLIMNLLGVIASLLVLLTGSSAGP